MILDSVSFTAAGTAAASTSITQPLTNYVVYGLRVRSAVRLPIPAASPASDAPVDLVIRAREAAEPPVIVGQQVAWAPCPMHGADTRVYRGEQGTWLWNQNAGTCHVSPDARQIDVYPGLDSDPRTLGLALAGQVLVFVLHQRGHPCLHASAVNTERGAIAFLGPAGQGKSTMAGSFLRRGATLITDDALPLRLMADGAAVVPSLPMMKVWPETAVETLGVAEALPDLTTTYDKKLLALADRFGFEQQPRRLRALYVLRRYDAAASRRSDVAIRPLSARDSVAALLAHTSHRALLDTREQAALLALYARHLAVLPVRVVTYPSGFEHQAQVHRQVLADLERR